MSIIYTCILENKTPPHNKFYKLEVDKQTNGIDTIYNVYSTHGPIGSNGIRKLIYIDKSLGQAIAATEITRNKKIKPSGYSIVQEVDGTSNELQSNSHSKILDNAVKAKKELIKKKKQFSIYNPGRLGALL